MLQVNNLSCERGQRDLFPGQTFSLNPGDLLQVVGSNGSGKSTLLRVLLGLYTEFKGEFEWDLDQPPLYLGHRLGIKTSQTVLENFRWFACLREQAVSGEILEDTLQRLGLSGLGNRLCAHLSEGQRKRVALAQFLLIQSPCWVMDEPFSAIDAEGMAFLQGILESHLEKGGAVILSTHQPVSVDRAITTVSLS